MSRDGAGNYSLPAGNPVVTGTAISSTWANTTLTDIGTALTGSVAADGQTTITGQIKGVVGTVGAPSYSFTGRLTNGMYSPAANQVAIATNGTQALLFNSSQAATFAGALSGITDLTTTGNTVLGDAQGDTLNVGNGDIVKNASGNTGIGVTPGTKLHVKSLGDTFRIETTQARGSGNGYMSWYDPTGRKGWTGYGGSDDTFYITNELNAPMVFITNNVERLRITGDGRVYGSAIHNNAGAVTGTTNQYIASGTYTPTLTNVANIGATQAYACQWMRVGNVVTVSGGCDLDPTSASVESKVGISLPIASDIASYPMLGGVAARYPISNLCASLIGDATNNRAELHFFNDSDTSNSAWSFTFTYVIA